MPIYEYECPDCGAVFGELMPIDAAASPPCPRCGGTMAAKRVSRFAVGRTEAQRGAALAERAAGVDRGSHRDMARLFQEAGGELMGDDAFREVVDRAAAGADDADMADISRDVPVRGRDQALSKHHSAHHHDESAA